MKFKKFLIIFLCVALLAAFSVGCFATSQESYAFYISPGDYVFDDNLTNFSSSVDRLYFNFISTGVNYDSLHFYSSDEVMLYYLTAGGEIYVYNASNGGWKDESYRHFTVVDGFYIANPSDYQWWTSNVTRVSPGYNSSFFDNMLSIFTAIGQWISGAVANLTSMFFVDSSLTFVGTLCVASLAISVVFLIFGLISRFLRFKS